MQGMLSQSSRVTIFARDKNEAKKKLGRLITDGLWACWLMDEDPDHLCGHRYVFKRVGYSPFFKLDWKYKF